MTTITEFIDYLKTLPDDTEISVVIGYMSFGYETKEVPLEIGKNTDFVDMTKNNFIEKHSTNWNRKFLVLGEK